MIPIACSWKLRDTWVHAMVLPLNTCVNKDRLSLDRGISCVCWRQLLLAPAHSHHEAAWVALTRSAFFQEKTEIQIVMKHLSIFKCQ